MNNFASVLLIEDNPGDVRLVSEYLTERFGDDCKLSCATTLAAGLGMLRDRPVDVVLLDLSLPDSSGLQTFIDVQAQAPRTPVVILTGQDDDSQAVEAVRVGAEDYLAKQHADSVVLIRTMRHAVQRRRSANALRESEARYRAIVETAEEGILQVDSTGTIRFANARMAGMVGAPVSTLLGQSLLERVHTTHRAALARLLQTPAESRASCELRLLVSDGLPCWAVAAVGSVAASGGERVQIVVMLTDITGRKLAESELRNVKERLEARVAERTAELEVVNANLQDFNHSVAHDLRTPLNAIVSLSTLLQIDKTNVLPDQHRQHVQLIDSSARDMDVMIGGLLSLSDVSRQDLNWQTIDLSAIARATASRLAASEPQRSVEWQIEDGVTTQGDPALVSIALQNLLQNAWKYSAQRVGAQIRFGTAPSALPTSEPLYFVRDNGVGFDMAQAGKLFTPFHRLHSAAVFSGTGIGLATVRRIVERHGGRVWAESVPGVATSFFFSLAPPKAVPPPSP